MTEADIFEPEMPTQFRTRVPEGFEWPKPDSPTIERALAASKIGRVVPGVYETIGDYIRPWPPVTGLRNEFDQATFDAVAIEKLFPSNRDDLVLIGPKVGKKSEEPWHAYNGHRVWVLPHVQLGPAHFDPKAESAPAVRATSPRPEPSLSEAAKSVVNARERLTEAQAIREAAESRVETARRDVAALDDLKARRLTLTDERDGELAKAYESCIQADTSQLNKSIEDLDGDIARLGDRAFGAAAALPQLASRAADAKRVEVDAEHLVHLRLSSWARLRQRTSAYAVTQILEKLAPLFAEFAALDELMAEGDDRHLVNADRYLDLFSRPFSGQVCVPDRPTWAFKKARQLDGVADARRRVFAELDHQGDPR